MNTNQSGSLPAPRSNASGTLVAGNADQQLVLCALRFAVEVVGPVVTTKHGEREAMREGEGGGRRRMPHILLTVLSYGFVVSSLFCWCL